MSPRARCPFLRARARARASACAGAALLVMALLALPVDAGANPVADENAKAGSLGWERLRVAEPAIVGYASKISVGAGEGLGFHVSTGPPERYRIEIYRLGWYGGAGARRVACLPACDQDILGEDKQPAPPEPDPVTGEIDAGWSVDEGASLTVPGGWVSGLYLAELVLTSGAAQGKSRGAPFVVRAPASERAAILVQIPVNTWLAYNPWGGLSTYTDPRAVKVSFNRPFVFQTEYLRFEYPLVRFLEREGYDVTYVADPDLDADPAVLLRHRLAVVSGHSEYWTKEMRDGYDAAREAGTNLAFLGANDAYWQVRYENERRTMVVYKLEEDPIGDPALRTTKFRRLEPPRPECELMGVQFEAGGWFADLGWADYTVTPEGAADPWLADSGLKAGDKLVGMVGYEFDSFDPGCATPSPPTILFSYQDPELGLPNAPPGELREAAAVRYTDPSAGARVFSSGSMNLMSWGLDDYRSVARSVAVPVDPRLQRMARTILDDLTRPAPPASIAVTQVPGGFEISSATLPDPRLAGVRIYRHPGPLPFEPGSPRTRLVCETATGPCTDEPPGGSYRYAAVAVDPWRESAPILSGLVTQPDTTPPTIALKGKKTQTGSKLVKVKVTVDEAATVAGTGAIKVPVVKGSATAAKKKKSMLKGQTKDAGPGATVTLRLKLKKKAKKLTKKAQRKGKKPKAGVTVTATDAAGNESSAKRKIKLKRK